MELKEILTLVNDQLKFAEAKNASLIAFNGVLTFGLVRVAVDSYSSLQQFFLVVSLFLSVFSLLLILYSFLPRLDVKTGTGDDNNILFFGHAKNNEVEAYLEKYLNHKDGDENNLDELVVNQILTNSKITYRKFVVFRKALILSFFATFFAAFLFLLEVL